MRKRNYKAEYARRIARAKAKGISLSVARGHPRFGETLLSKLKKPPKLRKPRDYKKEYQAKKLRHLAWEISQDAKRVFGRKPKRKYELNPNEYEETLIELPKKAPEIEWQWTDEHAFIESLTAMGMPTQEAYTLWFSP